MAEIRKLPVLDVDRRMDSAILIGAVIAVGVGLFFLGLFLQKKKTDKRLGEIDTVVRKCSTTRVSKVRPLKRKQF